MLVLETENDLMMETEENLVSNNLNKDSLEDEINTMKIQKRRPKRQSSKQQNSSDSDGEGKKQRDQ